MKKSFVIVLGFLVSLSFAAGAQPDAERGEILSTYEEMKEDFHQAKTVKIDASEQAILQQAQNKVKASLPNPGLKVNSKAPDFKLKNAFGKDVSLSETLKKGPVVLIFYRGAWCPYCNLYLRSVQMAHPIFEKKKAQIIAISPQKPDATLVNVKKKGFPFDVLSDTSYQAIKAYNLYFEVPQDLVETYKGWGIDLIQYNGNQKPGLPVAATFVIDQKGMIRSAYYDIDYTKRMEPKDILWALSSLGY